MNNKSKKDIKKKLLTVNKMYPPEIGGVEVVAKELAELGYDMYGSSEVLTFNNNLKTFIDKINGVDVMRLGSLKTGRSIRISMRYIKVLKRKTFNTSKIIFHFPSLVPEVFYFLLKKNQAEKICLYHADIVGKGFLGYIYNKFITKKFLDKMDKIVVTSPNMAKYSTALKGRQNINIIPLGVDTEHFSCNGEDARKKIIEALPEYSFIENIKMILFVGRIARYKGIRELIDAVERLPENYCLSIVTNDSVEELKKIISSKKMDKKVVFFNKISYSKLPEFYRSADVFCMPSTDRGEAFGLVALEAMACGTPIITTELGTGTSFHNINGVTGRIIEPKNVVQLKDSIIDICENRINYDKQVIRKRAEEFSIENFRNEWSKLL